MEIFRVEMGEMLHFYWPPLWWLRWFYGLTPAQIARLRESEDLPDE